MLAVMWSDARRFIIPNWLVGAILLAYPAAIFIAPQHLDWPMALVGAGIVFVAGFIVFSLKWMGGGDIKLLIAAALWVGYNNLMEYIFTVAVFGGVLSVVLWGGRKALPHMLHKPAGTLPRILCEGEPAPYGLAIATAFLLMLAQGKIAGFSA